MIKAKLINSGAELNDYHAIDSLEFIPGENVTVAIQVYDAQLGIRFIPSVDAEMSLSFVNKDGSALVKDAAVIDADDRSMWKVDLSQSETELLAGANIIVELDEEGDASVIHKALIANAMVRNNLSGDC